MKPEKILLLFHCVLIASGIQAQEILLHLEHNPSKSDSVAQEHRAALKATAYPLHLPFRDDFTNPGPYPDTRLWSDNDVFVNNRFGVHPLTYGVATFDMLDMYGRIYAHAEANNIPFVADRLSSHPIRLDSVFGGNPRALSPADSVVLSFYFQPQGRGGDPLPADSLILQFLRPAADGEMEDARWTNVWGASGESLSGFSADTFPYFRRVAIPVTDPAYFRNDFRFRFLNKVSIPAGQMNNSGTRSIWNIDYVTLDHGRSLSQTGYYDIAFAAPAQSILKEYTAMPWAQYIADPASHLRDRFDISISNLDNTAYSYSYKYEIQDEGGTTIRTYSGGAWVIPPFVGSGYQDYQPHANPLVIPNPLPLSPAPERRFRIRHSIREGATGDGYTRNDTLIHRQDFTNYYAYDDGTPEMINLLKGYNPARAIRFVASRPDTLEAIRFFFMETLQGRELPFYLTVWKRLGPDEEIIYQSAEPLFTPRGDLPADFATYALEEALLIEDTFYVGLMQPGNALEARGAIGIGFDLHNDASHHLFNNVGDGDGWQESVARGALMVRPVLKRELTTAIPPSAPKAAGIHVYPNPAGGDHVRIETGEHGRAEEGLLMEVFDYQGRLLYSGTFSSRLDVSRYPAGLYLLRVSGKPGRPLQTARFIISR